MDISDNSLGGLTEDELVDDSEIDSLIRGSITAVVGDAAFHHNKINQWCSGIVDASLKRLAALGKPFKYVVTTNITQRVGAGLHAATCARYNDKIDGKVSVQWENKTMLVLVCIYWLAC